MCVTIIIGVVTDASLSSRRQHTTAADAAVVFGVMLSGFSIRWSGRDSDRFSVALGTKSAIDRSCKTQRYFWGAVEFPILRN
jgi:hypothetical protein